MIRHKVHVQVSKHKCQHSQWPYRNILMWGPSLSFVMKRMKHSSEIFRGQNQGPQNPMVYQFIINNVPHQKKCFLGVGVSCILRQSHLMIKRSCLPVCPMIFLHFFQVTLWCTNIAIENGHRNSGFSMIFPLKMVIFHCYVSSPEVKFL